MKNSIFPKNLQKLRSLSPPLAIATCSAAAINATGRLHIYGYAPFWIEPTAGEARFVTKLRYRFGFGPA